MPKEFGGALGDVFAHRPQDILPRPVRSVKRTIERARGSLAPGD
jgi:hypothetical protein